jgi:hypothetical protein
VNTKKLIVAWVIGTCLLSGCEYFSLKGGKAKFTIPFDFPQQEDNNQTLSSP